MTDPAERLAGPGVFGGVTTGPAGITGAETRRAAAQIVKIRGKVSEVVVAG